jgi:ribonuclease T1
MRRAIVFILAVALALAVAVALRHRDPGGERVGAPPSGAAGAAAAPAPPAPTAEAPPSRHGGPAGEDSATLARVREVLAAIQARHGQPLDGYVGGRFFHNREGRLPAARYREYDVHPRTPGQDRGPERLVINQATGRAYYSADHYRTFIPLN